MTKTSREFMALGRDKKIAVLLYAFEKATNSNEKLQEKLLKRAMDVVIED